MDDEHVYWIDGTVYTGLPISPTSFKCIVVRISDGNFTLVPLRCNGYRKYICEDAAPPGKYANIMVDDSNRLDPLCSESGALFIWWIDVLSQDFVNYRSREIRV